jgi:hypothetical protein
MILNNLYFMHERTLKKCLLMLWLFISKSKICFAK